MVDPIIELRSRLRCTTQKHVAKRLKISEQYLCDVLSGRRQPGRKILSALRMERVITYKWKIQ